MRILLVVLCVLLTAIPSDAQELTENEVRAAMNRAVRFFRDKVSAEGGYLWNYSADLKDREGEEEATASVAWVQQPGTPFVGEAFLEAWLLCREPSLLQVAKDAAHCLVDGQLVSGGWDYRIETDPAKRGGFAFRVDVERSGRAAAPKARNVTTLDDDNTQSALRFLLKMESLKETSDERIRGAVDYALTELLKAQYTNGAWPQRYSQLPKEGTYPAKKASYPESWSRTWAKVDYTGYCTLNDDSLADMIDTLFLAAALRKDDRYAAAARRAGDFLIRAQMPEPQPAWAQQYNEQMQPAWARRFEPPSVTGGESQGAIRVLLTLHRRTGEKKYLEPIPKALDWLERSQLKEGGLARFYELKTNKPLYFTKDYKLTYDDSDLPTHYGFKVGSGVKKLREDYAAALTSSVPQPAEWNAQPRAPKLGNDIRQQAADVISSLDDRGAWVEDGKLKSAENSKHNRIITTNTFVRNLRTLSRCLAAMTAPRR